MSFFADKYLVDDLLELKKRFNYDTIIETGTNIGNTTNLLSNIFKKVYTCELKKEYSSYWDELKQNSKIEIYEETSTTFLPKIFSKLNNDNFYLYLDAHGIIDDTNHQKSPLLSELEIVSKFGYKPIIMIHDFDSKRNGWEFDKIYNENINEYVSLDWDYIKDSIEKIYGKNNYILHTNTKSDIARILLTIIPKNKKVI
jgi:hypothetical protein